MGTSFADMWSGKLGRTDVVEHCIELTKDSRPFRSAPYRAGRETRELEELKVQKQLKADVIELATSELASPVLFVPKKDESFRWCIHYSRLNEASINHTYPLFCIDECVDFLGSANIFSTLDASSGYWQFPVMKEDRDKTAFVCYAEL